jgi:hypothetical protein
MVAASGPNDSNYPKLREWLLLLLRFAVTRSASDQASVLALARELDLIGPERRAAAEPRFFVRRSREICEAILADDRNDNALQAHVARIDDPRLRRAFEAAVDLPPTKLRPRGPDPETTHTPTKAPRKSEAALFQKPPQL